MTNGGFEEYTSCPTGISITNDNKIHLIKGWNIPTEGSSDFYHTCGTDSSIKIPFNKNGGYKWPKSGNAMVGLYLFALKGGLFNPPNNYREYVQSGFTPMIENKLYYISFNVSLAPAYSYYSTDDVGAYISVDKISESGNTNYILGKYKPQINNKKNLFIRDTSKWYHIGGYYRAKGQEKYITLGNFNYDSLITVIPKYESGDCYSEKYCLRSYVYLDDVSILECNTLTGNHFKVLPEEIIHCKGIPIKLYASIELPDASYTWNASEETDTLIVNAPGIYKVKVKSNGCLYYDSVIVKDAFLPNKYEMTSDTSVYQCDKSSLYFTPKLKYPSLTSDSLTISSFSVSVSGVYNIDLKYNGCKFNDTINITFTNLKKTYSLPRDTTVCETLNNVVIEAKGDGELEPWYENYFGKKYDFLSKAGIYYRNGKKHFDIANTTCYYTDTLHFRKIPCFIEIPNVFTPNEDHVNDKFEIKNADIFELHLIVYNRYGVKVFDQKPYINQWKADGVTDGLYFYSLENITEGKKYNGWIQVIR